MYPDYAFNLLQLTPDNLDLQVCVVCGLPLFIKSSLRLLRAGSMLKIVKKHAENHILTQRAEARYMRLAYYLQLVVLVEFRTGIQIS